MRPQRIAAENQQLGNNANDTGNASMRPQRIAAENPVFG